MKVGDIAIGQNLVVNTYRNGQECEIIKEARMIESINELSYEFSKCIRYKVRWSDGKETNIKPENLRKKDDRNNMGSWDEIEKETNWRPNEYTRNI